MLRFGLTGGIASGKSAVAAMLRELGVSVLDADALAHQLIDPGQPAYAEVVREFGPAIIDGQGRVDRAKLGALVFADRAKLDRLNAIVHPRVAEVVLRQFDEWQHSGTRETAFVEAALLIESGIHKYLDGLVVAWCTPEQQIERLTARGLPEDEARRRIAAQMPVEEKLRLADEKIDCSGTLDQTRQQVEALAAKLLRRKAAR
jgi:dephospho-CoA kinase